MEGQQVLAKFVFNASPGSRFRTTAELYDTSVDTEWVSNNGLIDFGRFSYLINETAALDTQRRQRFSLDHTLAGRGLDLLSWQVYGQFNDTAQIVDEERMTFGFGPPFGSMRHGTVDYEQAGYGGSAQGQQWLGGADNGVLVTFGASYKTDYFDMRRDRAETNTATGQPVRTSLIFPTSTFLKATSSRRGPISRARSGSAGSPWCPACAYDHFSLDANQADPVFVASLNPRRRLLRRGPLAEDRPGGAAERRGDAARAVCRRLSSAALQRHQHRLHQPPGRLYDAPELPAAGRDQRHLEVGIRAAFDRASLGLTGFSNRYDDFIEMTDIGFNPRTRLLEFQSQNLDQAEIRGSSSAAKRT